MLDLRSPTSPTTMDINEVKNLIEIDGGKFIIVEDGRPVMVVISFEEYKNKLVEKKVSPAGTQKEPRRQPKEFESESLKLEDLPL